MHCAWVTEWASGHFFFGYESQSYENKENSGTPYFESKKLELANENKDKVGFRKGFFLF